MAEGKGEYETFGSGDSVVIPEGESSPSNDSSEALTIANGVEHGAIPEVASK